MIEDYVSFEIAKLLKEKGFNEECNSYFISDNEIALISVRRDFNDYGVYLSAPTLQMAIKWLREVYNIMVSPYALSLGYYFEIFDLTNRDITGCKPLYKVGIPYKEDISPTYEQAIEAGIKYCLENLI